MYREPGAAMMDGPKLAIDLSTKRKQRPSLKRAAEIIADNFPSDMTTEDLRSDVTIGTIATLFGVEVETVVERVLHAQGHR